MHNAHVIATGIVSLNTVEHIERVPRDRRNYIVIKRLYSTNLRRLQRCKSAILSDMRYAGQFAPATPVERLA